MAKENKPVAKYRAGSVSATVWGNTIETKTGPMEIFKTTLQRSYKDKEGKWQTTDSLDRNDLPAAVLVLQEAYKHLVLKENSNEPTE